MVGEYYLASLPDRGGRITVESVAECSWNRWPDHRGLGGRMVAEFALQLIDQINRIEEAYPFALMDGGQSDCGGQMCFAGARAAHQNQVVRGFHEGRTG